MSCASVTTALKGPITTTLETFCIIAKSATKSIYQIARCAPLTTIANKNGKKMIHPEINDAILKLADEGAKPGESFEDAFHRALKVFRHFQMKETNMLLERLRYIPTCKSEVYDPDMFGYREPEGDSTFIEGSDDE
jgi:hypothetical protein